MSDLALTFGNDIAFAPNGDLAMAFGPVLTEQRVLRRLLTNPGDYLWQLSYGAGLAQFVGQVGAATIISGVVRAQLAQESSVAATPVPQVTTASTAGGTFSMTLHYADVTTRQTIATALAV